MRKLKKCHKNLMIIEAGYIYCIRHGLNQDTFIDSVFMSEDFHSEENSEFDNICRDLRSFRNHDDYILKTITISEYEKCIDEFGEQ